MRARVWLMSGAMNTSCGVDSMCCRFSWRKWTGLWFVQPSSNDCYNDPVEQQRWVEGWRKVIQNTDGIFEPVRCYLAQRAVQYTRAVIWARFVIFLIKGYSFPEPLLNFLTGLEKLIIKFIYI
jgi:hypothetical protein